MAGASALCHFLCFLSVWHGYLLDDVFVIRIDVRMDIWLEFLWE